MLIYLGNLVAGFLAIASVTAEEYPLWLLLVLVVAWVGAIFSRWIMVIAESWINDQLNHPGVLKTHMDRAQAFERIQEILRNYVNHSVHFELTKDDAFTGEICARWGIHMNRFRILLLLTPWDIALHTQSMDVTVEIEVTQMDDGDTEVDVRFTNDADPPAINWNGHVVRSQIYNAIYKAIECKRISRRKRKSFTRYDQASNFIDEGHTLFDKGKYKRALKSFKNATLLKPDRGDVWGWIGRSLDELDRSDEAVVAFEKGLSLNPDMETVWISYASLLRRQGKADECVAALRQAIVAEPLCAPAWKNLALMLDEIGDTRAAEQARRQLNTLKI